MAVTISPSQYRNYGLQNSEGNKKTGAPSDDIKQGAAAESLAKALPGIVRPDKKQSPEETASAILRHVENGIHQLRTQGADQNRIDQRLQAAREGIARGYAEATEMLDGMGLLDDELKNQIAAGRQLVDVGLDRLSKPAEQTSALMTSNSSLRVANELSLQVLTQEGDRVTVRFSQGSSLSTSINTDNSGNSAFSLQASAQQHWSMEVNGSLSEAERSALSGLFDDVQSLSERFFAGDIGSALEQAMNLGFDGSQLASMSLNLTQQAVATSTKAYSRVQPQLPTPALESLKAPLASYVDAYMSALDKASPLADAPQTLQDLVNELLSEEERLPVWQSFHEGLNSWIGSKA
ncbi:MAG: DUF5610 domain-containing protein [Saccharospirillaceae bacterium]|nr:DUF5610 domain-containing protein [Saccharospirillaceae bacterium]MCD8530367.1 DUF5610 domain-containing protein [Saccharospirillaceae bacterium]